MKFERPGFGGGKSAATDGVAAGSGSAGFTNVFRAPALRLDVSADADVLEGSDTGCGTSPAAAGLLLETLVLRDRVAIASTQPPHRHAHRAWICFPTCCARSAQVACSEGWSTHHKWNLL